MNLTESLTIIAIFFGPIIAVACSIWHVEYKAKIYRKLWIFRALMGGRSGAGKEDAIRALNLVAVEFAQNDDLISCWENYVNQANDLPPDRNATADELNAWEGLMKAIAKDLGHDGRLATNLTLVLRDPEAYFRVFPNPQNGYTSEQTVHILTRQHPSFVGSKSSNIPTNTESDQHV